MVTPVFADERKANSSANDKIDDAVDLQCVLNDDRIDESSGLAFSLRRPGHVWTHNDSGDKPRLFALDISGNLTGKVELKSKLKAKDWEDMAAMMDGDRCRLVVADCGDNQGKRKSISLIIFDEPDPTQSTKLKQFQKIEVHYPDGAHDCEAIAIDEDRREVLLFTKSLLPICHIYSAALPTLAPSKNQFITAKAITTLALPMVTGADIDRNTGDLWLSSYFGALKYSHREGLSLRAQLAQTPEVFKMPAWKQIEAIAVDQAGGVWVTSEGNRAPMGRLKCMKSSKNSASTPSPLLPRR